MQGKVLIAYASKYGGTREIAERVAATLKGRGCEVEITAADKVKDVSGFGAVVLGSSVYAGSWLGGVVDLMTQQEAHLKARPVWLFSSGPTGEGDPIQLMKGFRYPEKLKPQVDAIAPKDIAFFGGILDLKKLSLPERLLIKAMKAPVGDYRNWESIDAWASSIATALGC